MFYTFVPIFPFFFFSSPLRVWSAYTFIPIGNDRLATASVSPRNEDNLWPDVRLCQELRVTHSPVRKGQKPFEDRCRCTTTNALHRGLLFRNYLQRFHELNTLHRLDPFSSIFFFFFRLIFEDFWRRNRSTEECSRENNSNFIFSVFTYTWFFKLFAN